MEPEKRICKSCNVEVEDEMHFLLKCPKLKEARSAILNILEDFENASPFFCTFLANCICD